MLHLLADYARSHNLVTEPGLAPKTVRWALVFGAAGEYLDLVELGETDQRNNRGHTFSRCPELTQPEMMRGGAACRHFLVDSAAVVALYADEVDDKVRAKHSYFVNLLRKASEVVPELEGIATQLDDLMVLDRIHSSLTTLRAKSTDKITLAIKGRHPTYVVDGDDWHDWWSSFRRALKMEQGSSSSVTGETSTKMRCVITGDMVTPHLTSPKINGLADVGGRAMGDALASFDKDAFCSYGLSQCENAAISEQMAIAYRAGLNHLIRESGHRLGAAKAGAKVVHWYKNELQAGEDPIPDLLDPPGISEAAAQHRARELLAAIRSGNRPDLSHNTFYAMTLSGASGRVMVRDWMEGQFETLAENVDAWFGDLSIVGRDGIHLAPRPKFMALLGALVRDLEELVAPTISTMWRVALKRQSLPHQVITQTLRRARADILMNSGFNHARYGVLRAFHVRNGDHDMKPFLNEDHPEPAYQCGRLMAVLAALQRRALGDVGAGVVQRYFGAASTTPALVLGRLTRTAQFHLNKLDKGLAQWYDGRLADIWSRLDRRVPRTLSLEEQTLFALGYYQQIAADRPHLKGVNANDGETSNVDEIKES